MIVFRLRDAIGDNEDESHDSKQFEMKKRHMPDSGYAFLDANSYRYLQTFKLVNTMAGSCYQRLPGGRLMGCGR